MWNKSKNPTEERIDFLLQDLWNKVFFKTCGCKSHTYCKKVQRKSEWFVEIKRRKTTIKEKSKFV
jgi:hypothetical protein